MNSCFKLENFNVSYQDLSALKNISIEIQHGEKVAIIGPSGGGKTTLLKTFFKQNPNQISFIHQDYALVEELSVYNNVYIGKINEFSTFGNIKNLLIPNKSCLVEIEEILNGVGMKNKLHTKVGELSGGQKQRAAIARSLYQNKDILLADEPVSSVDPHRAENLFNKIINSTNTVITSMHNVELAKMYSTRLIGINNGNIVFDCNTENINSDKLNKLFNPTD